MQKKAANKTKNAVSISKDTLPVDSQFIQKVSNTLPAMVVVYNLHTGKYVYVNEAIRQILGYDKAVFLARGLPYVSSLVHPDDIPRIMAENAAALERENAARKHNKSTDNIVTFEYRMKHKNGSWRWLHTDGVVFDRDKDGKVVHVMNISVDITARKESEIREAEERKKAEKAILESEQQYKRLIDSSPMPTAIHLMGTIIYANKQAALLIGVKSPKELIGRNVMEFVHPDYHEVVKKRVALVYKRKSKYTDVIEEKFIRADGEVIDVEVASMVVTFDGKDAIQVIVRDITERKKANERIRHSRDQLETIIHGVADGITMHDGSGKILFVNDAAAKASGYSSVKAMLAAPPLEFLKTFTLEDEYGKPFPLEQLPGRRALMGEKKPEATIKFTNKKTGVVRWSIVKARPIFAENKRVQYAINIVHDITQMKHSEERLKEQEERFREMADNTPGMIWITNSNGVCTYLNKQFFLFTGKKLKKESDFSWLEAIHPGDVKQAVSLFQQANSRKIPFTMVYRLRRYDGVYRWVQDTGNPKFTQEGTFEGYIGSVMDIHEQKKAESALRESEEKYRLVVENSRDIVMVTKVDGTIVYVSPSHERILGYSQEEKVGKKAIDDIHPDDRKKIEEETLKALQNGAGRISHIRFRHKNGQYVIMEAAGSLVHSKTGEPGIFVTIIRDITERVRLEKQKDEFIGIASHELKTPVTSIKAYAQVLQNRFSREGNKESALLLEKMNKQLDRLTNLIMDLLDVTKIETGKLLFKEENFDFNELVVEVVEEMQRLTDTHTIVTKLGKPKTVFGDRDRIGQVLTNFLSNGLKYSPGSSRVIVTTSATNKEVSAAVKDFGVGIAKENQPKVFERFFRGDTKEQQSYPGLGLGLYISHEIIKRHKGTVSVVSQKGKGSTFTLSLPVSNHKKNENKKK